MNHEQPIGHWSDRSLFRCFLLVAMLALGTFWFYTAMAPWATFLNSDHAVPYAMTLDPWIKQDFYFWRAARFGSLYVVFWKALGKAFFGTAAEPFYLGHCLAFFAGLSLWLMALTRPLTRLLFCYLMLPINIMAAQMFLMAGQLHGMSFLLLGAMTFLVVKAKPSGMRMGLMGLVAGLAYWQHEPSGLLCVLLFAGDQLSHKQPRGLSNKLQQFAGTCWPFVATALPLFIFAEVARVWSARWGTPAHTTFSNWVGFRNSLIHIFSNGLRCHSGLIFGRTLLCGLLWLGVGTSLYGGIISRRYVQDSDRRLAIITTAFCVAATLIIILIAGNDWYVGNSRDDRYFLFLLAPICFFMLWLLESGFGGALYRWILIALLLILTCQSHVSDAQGLVFSPAAKQRAAGDYDRAMLRIAQMDHDHCAGYIGGHSDSFILTPLTNGRLLAQGVDAEMNIHLFARIQALPAFCVRRTIDQGFIRRITEGKSCVPMGDVLRCT